MHRLPRTLLLGAGFGLASLALYAGGIYWREPQELFTYSPLRLITILGLGFYSTVFLIAAVVLWEKPAWEQRINGSVTRLLERNWFRNSYLMITELIILICLLPIFNLIIRQDRSTEVFLFRFFWLLFLIVASLSLTITLEYFTANRKRWIWIIIISSLMVLAGMLIQEMLLGQLTRSYALVPLERLITQSILVLLLTVLSLVNWLYDLPKNEKNLWILICITVAGLFVLQWIVLPLKYWRIQHYVAALAPVIIFGAPLLVAGTLKLAGWLSTTLHERSTTVAWICLILVLLCAGFIFYWYATEHAHRINISSTYGDQHTYIDIVKEARRLNFNYTGNQNQMPLFPFFVALFYQAGMADPAFFELGKMINIVLGLIYLLLMFMIFLKVFKPFQSLLLILIVAFSLFIFKAPYFQVELTFYFLFFMSYVLMLKMLVEPDWKTAISTGILIGLTHLSKASILPGFLLFISMFFIKATLARLKKNPAWSFDWIGWRSSIALLLGVIVLFVIITYPYGRSMQKRFGNYLYNVNTSVYLWYDSWDEALEAEFKYKFQEKAPDLPEAERPGLQKYIKEHTLRQIIERIAYGLDMQVANLIYPYSMTSYPISYLWILFLVILVDIKNCARLIRKYMIVVSFVLLFFSGYFFAFSWYSVIIASPRFLHGLFIPLLFSIFYAINSLANNRPIREPDNNTLVDLNKYFSAVNLVMAFTLIYNVWLVATERLFHAVFTT